MLVSVDLTRTCGGSPLFQNLLIKLIFTIINFFVGKEEFLCYSQWYSTVASQVGNPSFLESPRWEFPRVCVRVVLVCVSQSTRYGLEE